MEHCAPVRHRVSDNTWTQEWDETSRLVVHRRLLKAILRAILKAMLKATRASTASEFKTFSWCFRFAGTSLC